MNADHIEGIIKKHKKWLTEPTGGKRADFSGVDLKGVNLSQANICRADLRGAHLNDANLGDACLCRADLRGADLSRADLRGADLRGADFTGACLWNADLTGADLRGADFRGADLSGADLNDANLRCTNLSIIDINENTKIDNKTINKFFPPCCPEVGAFIGWKKIRDNRIVKLLIPEDARRSSAFGRKCRCSKAIVLAIEQLDGTPEDEAYLGVSFHDFLFTYKVGETVIPDKFDPDRKNECAGGIHFFITRDEAVHY